MKKPRLPWVTRYLCKEGESVQEDPWCDVCPVNRLGAHRLRKRRLLECPDCGECFLTRKDYEAHHEDEWR